MNLVKPSRESRFFWGILSLIFLFFSVRAFAVNRAPAIDPNQRIQANGLGCGGAMVQLNYAASFRWKSPEGEDHPLRILLGTVKDSAQSGSVVAQIVHEASGECRAVCHLAAKRQLNRLHPGMPEALELTCRAPVLGAMETPTVILGNRIRFGSWLRGYRDARLRVEFDEMELLGRRKVVRKTAAVTKR